jgi:hypothetical protein
MAGATVLEALALELALKARLLRAGTSPPKRPADAVLGLFLRARGDLATIPLVSDCRCGKGLDHRWPCLSIFPR